MCEPREELEKKIRGNIDNSKDYPEAWKFFIEYARNIKGCEDEHLGLYCIPHPSNGTFIYANDVGILFAKLRDIFYTPSLDAPSVYGKIQYIVQHLNH